MTSASFQKRSRYRGASCHYFTIRPNERTSIKRVDTKTTDLSSWMKAVGKMNRWDRGRYKKIILELTILR